MNVNGKGVGGIILCHDVLQKKIISKRSNLLSLELHPLTKVYKSLKAQNLIRWPCVDSAVALLAYAKMNKGVSLPVFTEPSLTPHPHPAMQSPLSNGSEAYFKHHEQYLKVFALRLTPTAYTVMTTYNDSAPIWRLMNEQVRRIRKGFQLIQKVQSTVTG